MQPPKSRKRTGTRILQRLKKRKKRKCPKPNRRRSLKKRKKQTRMPFLKKLKMRMIRNGGTGPQIPGWSNPKKT